MNAEEKQIVSRLSRRGFLGPAAGATLAALAGREPLFARSPEPSKIQPTADALIVLWMAGGMAQTETFDPKRFTPYETGLQSNQIGRAHV